MWLQVRAKSIKYPFLINLDRVYVIEVLEDSGGRCRIIFSETFGVGYSIDLKAPRNVIPDVMEELEEIISFSGKKMLLELDLRKYEPEEE